MGRLLIFRPFIVSDMSGKSGTSNRKIAREKKTIKIMIGIYCKAHHHLSKIEDCPECGELYGYALKRLDHCPQLDNKPTCANCKIHCYKPEKREQIRIVMKYAGPRMIWTHPILALFHLGDMFKKT